MPSRSRTLPIFVLGVSKEHRVRIPSIPLLSRKKIRFYLIQVTAVLFPHESNDVHNAIELFFWLANIGSGEIHFAFPLYSLKVLRQTCSQEERRYCFRKKPHNSVVQSRYAES
jgi:hypothetical protein